MKRLRAALDAAIVEPAPGIEKVPRHVHGACHILRHWPGYWKVETCSDDPALLLVAERSYPGWRAFVDGATATLARAYGFLICLPLSPGAHTVTLVFWPEPVVFGLWWWLIGIAALVAALTAAIQWPHK